MCNLAECYHRSGRFQEASRTLSEMRRVTASVENPQLAMAGQLCLAEKFLNCGDYSRASENLLASGSKLYAELPEYSRSHSSLITAWLKLETGLIQESLESLSKLSLSRSKGVRPFEAALAEMKALQLKNLKQQIAVSVGLPNGLAGRLQGDDEVMMST